MATRRNPTRTSPSAPKQQSQPQESQQQLLRPRPQTDDDMIQFKDVAGYPQQVLWKLIIYAIAVAVLPLSAFFISRDYFFEGNSTYAGATATLTANFILFSYIIIAMREERADQKEVAAENNKKQEGKKTK